MQTPQSNDYFVGFDAYLKRRKAQISQHSTGNGINDYAYGMDLELRSRLDKIPGFYKNARRFVETLSAKEMADLDRSALQVTPEQHGDIYRMAEDCARRLGIAVPYVYVRDYMISYDSLGNPMPDYGMNGYTIGSDDHQQVIMITAAVLRRCTPGEVKAIIGHECGHIHNRHVTYTVLFNYLEALTASALPPFVTSGIRLALSAWSRAAEVTADRAAVICTDTPEDAMHAEIKQISGGVDSVTGYDLESIERQLDRQNANLMRMNELLASHPYGTRRVMVEKLFSQSEIYASWRPDQAKPDQTLLGKDDLDRQCREILDIVRM